MSSFGSLFSQAQKRELSNTEAWKYENVGRKCNLNFRVLPLPFLVFWHFQPLFGSFSSGNSVSNNRYNYCLSFLDTINLAY